MDLKSRENMSQEGMSVYNRVYVCIMEALHYLFGVSGLETGGG